MDTVFTRQNEEANIDRLCAQKQLYIEAKKIFMLQIILTVPVTILLSLVKIILFTVFNIDISAYVLVYGISLTLIDLIVINLVINDFKLSAAKIQELFDCSVYDLEWNKFCAGKKPNQEIINKYSGKFKLSGRPESKLKDWYPIELANQTPTKTIVLCQKTNLNYDTSIRKRFRSNTLIVAFVTLLILIVFALFNGFSVKDFITQIACSFLPVFVLTAKIVIEQNKTLKNSEELRNNIEGILDDEDNITRKEIRSIQDKLYTSRKDSALIPEFFYDKIRDKLEVEMHHNAANY
ncbi:S-4TM family putative pore-forming effector [Mucilaginibacter boryungensis]|uniref:SMODS and SLOG-associating 2TM effector domain-containing protein n=1 Tax=Mucilaginibacter boryungensis TaxID=768480 RepID=A0ABR9XL24_9SPHI|nr:S-4TM family putative pore-forming effector [Mucilaginibacter boryungensis]MBE9668093.1 hypothetical protein [Mucilaginibacter boryungensis]